MHCVELTVLSNIKLMYIVNITITDHRTVYALQFINFITFNVIFNSLLTSLSSLQKSSNLYIALASVRRAAINRTGCSYGGFRIYWQQTSRWLFSSLSLSLSLLINNTSICKAHNVSIRAESEAFTPILSLLQQMLAGSLPTYTDQL